MSARFIVHATPLAGLSLVERLPVGDDRGFFERLYCADELRPVLGTRSIVQINRTLTVAPGTVRGMHFQRPPAAEMKVVTCLRGEVFDVAVDVRRGSPTFLQWYGVLLTEANRRSLVIPEGFAHGFQTMTTHCELLYFHTAAYAPGAEGGLDPRDARLGIRWPSRVAALSARDASHPPIGDDFVGVDA